MYLRGFDRRGAAATLHDASASGFTVSGCWSDQADFAVAVLFDADDTFGHLYTSRYLPDFSLAGVTLDFDLTLTGCMNPISAKYQSVPWGALGYVTRAVSGGGVVTEVQGSTPLNVTAATGGTLASATFVVAGTPTSYDRIYLVYAGNYVADTGVSIVSGETLAAVAAYLASAVNLWGVALTATSAGIATTVAANIAAGSQTVTPASMAGISTGTPLVVANPGGTNSETVTVTAVTGSTFTATFTLTKTGSGITVNGTTATVTVTSTAVGRDANGVELLAMWKAAGNTQIYPAGSGSTASGQTGKLTGGSDPTSIHVHLDFSALGLANARQLWLTFAPALNYDSGTVNPALVAYAPGTFAAVFSNWTVSDPGGVTPLKLAGPGSVTVISSDSWATREGSGWTQVSGWYVGGFAWQSAHAGDTVTVTYSCQYTHNLYLGAAVSTVGGTFDAAVDSGTAAAVSAYSLQSSASPTSGRRLIAAGVAAGTHTVVLTVAGGTCLFDFLQAAVLSDPVAPSVTYPAANCACDFDTGATYQIPPARLLWILSQAGFHGDIDFYAGVFFALKRVRNGGNFRQCTVTLSGTPGVGNSFGSGADTIWITVDWTTQGGTVVSGATTKGANPTGGSGIGGTVLGVVAYPADTLATLAQRLVDAINCTFVGICAASAATAGQLTVTVLSPIDGFSFDVSLSVGASMALAVAGDIGTLTELSGGNEGTWAVDARQALPLNRAFADYLTDFAAEVKAAGQTMTVAFSQELLGPPDSNDAAPATVTFGFWNYLGTGYAHTITIGAATYTHVQLATDGSGDIATALAGLINAGGGDPNAAAAVSANNVTLAPRCTGDVACSASDGNGPGTLKSGAWSQRFANGNQVLTATGFGLWGAGIVEAVAGSNPQTIQQTGHGYITGNTVHVAQGANGAVYTITVTDANYYQLTTLVSGAAFTVLAPSATQAAATTYIELQTTQCNFNPATVTAYLEKCYLQAAGILAAAGLVPWLQFGEVGWWFYSVLNGLAVGYASWTSPISIGTATAHGLSSGQGVIDCGVGGNTAANGDFAVTVTDGTHFTLVASSGNGAYTGGGTVSGGGMAYYDAYTAAAALTALGRALAEFYTQDDNPGANAYADANLLRTCVYTHMHAIAQAVKAAYSGAKFEWLLPMDVNNPTVYWNAGYPYPQGGRMNNYVNIPAQYMGPNGDIDRVKIEALSWGADYLNIDMAKAAMAYATGTLTYSRSATAYLVPWFNGACAWTKQYLAAVNARVPLIEFWALDHFCLLSWAVPLPVNARRARVF